MRRQESSLFLFPCLVCHNRLSLSGAGTAHFVEEQLAAFETQRVTLVLLWSLLLLCLHPECSSLLPVELKESWEVHLYVDKGEATFILWLAVNHLKIRLGICDWLCV